MRSFRAIVACALLPALLVAAPARARVRHVHRFHVTSHPDPRKAFPKQRSRRLARSAAAPALATTWGCTEQHDDLAPLLSNAPQIKVVYAYPTDLPDGTATYASLMQADAAALETRVANESNGTETIRFDVGGTGGSCTADSNNRLDIQTIALPRTRAEYNNSGDTFGLLEADIAQKLAPAIPHERVNYVIYTDGIAASGAAGQADLPADTVHGYTNSINQGYNGDGDLFAFVYGYGGSDFVGGDGAASRQETFLHELSHTLGAVQDNAPHSSGAGHCFDEYDVMCYDDNGPFFQQGGQLAYPCTPGTDGSNEKFDCNQDDYWNPSPPAGSYLATNWNEYDSVFLCPIAECDQNLSDPSFSASLSASPTDGHLTLTANAGGAAVQHYEWNVNGDGVYETDTGSTPTLVPQFSFPRASQVEVRAVKADGTFAYASMPLSPTDPKPSLKVTGNLVAGSTVTLDGTATTDPDGLVKRYLWDTDGDGTLETDSGPTPTVTTSYTVAGPKQATLEVDFGYGWASTTVGFQIAAPPPPVQPTPTPPAPKAPTLSATNIRLGKLVAKGLPLTLVCFSRCTFAASLSVDRRTMHRLHLKSQVIGRVRGTFAAGTGKPVLTLTASAKRALRRVSSLKATLKASVRGANVVPLTLTKPLSFRR